MLSRGVRSVPTRLVPPGYSQRVQKAFARCQVSPEGFAARHPTLGRGDRVRRWLRTLPETQASLEAWATALGVAWQWLLVGDWPAGSVDQSLQPSGYPPEEVDPVADPNWTRVWSKFRELYYKDARRWKTIADLIEQSVESGESRLMQRAAGDTSRRRPRKERRKRL